MTDDNYTPENADATQPPEKLNDVVKPEVEGAVCLTCGEEFESLDELDDHLSCDE